MNNLTIFIIISIFLIIFLAKLYIVFCKRKLEHLTSESNEAIQNLASLYNTDKLTIGNINATNDLNIGANLNVGGNFNLLPKGIIVAWTGDKAPVGWALCDGTNGTPDLRGKFIYGLGANSAKAIGSVGGNETGKLTARQLPPGVVVNLLAKEAAGTMDITDVATGTIAFKNDWGVDYHTVKNDPYSLLPPYYVLAYIMKL